MDPGDADRFEARVQDALDRFAGTQRDRLAEAGDFAAVLVDAALASASGGKRLRAAFCVQGWHAAGGQRDERVVVAAAALEWLQASALVHDDLIDGSDTRRGRPSVHRRFESDHRDSAWLGAAHAYGSAAAILLGDLMLIWTDEMFRSCGLPSERIDAALGYLDACRSEVVIGQFLDVVAQASGRSDLDTAMRVLHYKSAKYTVERPLHLGAALAGADAELIGALSGFGVPIGEAFQLRDDVLGVFGDEQVTGKPAGDDLREGKRTVLLARAHAAADDSQLDLLKTLVGDPELDLAQVEQLRDVITGTGALQEVERQISALHDEAMDALERAPIGDEARRSLRTLAQRSVRRTR